MKKWSYAVLGKKPTEERALSATIIFLSSSILKVSYWGWKTFTYSIYSKTAKSLFLDCFHGG